MSVLWHWTANVWLWVLLSISLNLCPIVVEEAGEGAIWVCVLWHWASDVWLWVLLSFDISIGLNLGPIIVEEA